MNAQLATERFDACLEFLERAIVLARVACQGGDATRAEAILDAVHNVPRFLRGQEYAAFEPDFRTMYLTPLVAQYPDLDDLAAQWPS